MQHRNIHKRQRNETSKGRSIAAVLAVVFGLVGAANAWAAGNEEYSPRTVKKIRTQLPMHDDIRTVEVEVINGQAVLEGDIVLGPIDQVEIPENVSDAVAIKGSQYRWPDGGRVPYTFGSGLSNSEKGLIYKAITHINRKTNACFMPKRSYDKDYVEFVKKAGCWSYVGRRGGRQEASVPGYCGFGAVVHEMAHALGMWHEQSRSDRDDYITIVEENIKDDRKSNFKKHIADGIDIGSYDCGSLMHYGATAFSKNNKPTIIGKKCSSFGQRRGLSPGDIAGINTLYKGFKGCETFFLDNVAKGKAAKQASVGWGGKPERAVDGNIRGNYHDNSVTHTSGNYQDWWEVDLGGRFPIESITIYNRTDCCSARLSDFYVLVSDKPFPASLSEARNVSAWQYWHQGNAAMQTWLQVGVTGRYVRVQLNGQDYLSLAEVEVMASPSN